MKTNRNQASNGQLMKNIFSHSQKIAPTDPKQALKVHSLHKQLYTIIQSFLATSPFFQNVYWAEFSKSITKLRSSFKWERERVQSIACSTI